MASQLCRARRALAAIVVGIGAAAVPLLAQSGATAPAKPATPSAAPPAAAALPSAREIIDRHIAAIGGKSAIASRNSSHAVGTVSIASAGLTGSIEIFAARPAKSVQRVSLPGVGETEEGFDGTVGWSINPMTGPRLLQGEELEQRRDDANFDADLHADDRYETMKTVEKTTFDGREVYKIRLVRRGGREEFEFYDVKTGLRAGGITTAQTPMGPVTSTITESNYRKFGPMLQPTTIKVSAMGLDQIVTISSVEYDSVPPATFAPPASIKALVK